MGNHFGRTIRRQEGAEPRPRASGSQSPSSVPRALCGCGHPGGHLLFPHELLFQSRDPVSLLSASSSCIAARWLLLSLSKTKTPHSTDGTVCLRNFVYSLPLGAHAAGVVSLWSRGSYSRGLRASLCASVQNRVNNRPGTSLLRKPC